MGKYLVWKGFHVPPDKQFIAYGSYGKPYLRDYPNVHFNISHPGQYVACALCDRPVGIDIQTIGSYRPDVARRVCTPKEFEQIEASTEPAAEFTKLWTQKEAYLKMLGRGIIDSICEIKFPYTAEFQTTIYNGSLFATIAKERRER